MANTNTNRKGLHNYARQGFLMRPVWLTSVEAALVRSAAERGELSCQEFMRRALLRAAGIKNPPAPTIGTARR